MLDLIIKNADVATASDRFKCDIGIKDGKIVQLGMHMAESDAKEVVDAEGYLVTPGGVDAHCHLDQPTNYGSDIILELSDGFESGSRSAACGGTTTVVPFAAQQHGQSLEDTIKDYHQRSDGKACIDYSFHIIIVDPTEEVLTKEMPDLIRRGYKSFKIYMTYDAMKLNDYQILDVLNIARQEQAFIMVHAENADCITWLTERLIEAGKTAPKYHATSRPSPVEREATHRAITFSELLDVPMLIVHVSSAQAAEQIQWAKNHGLKIYGETCPQYLFLKEEDLDKEGYEGAKFVCSPPPRDEANQEAMWRGLNREIFDVVSSDHCPFNYYSGNGKKINGEEQSFDKIPNGIPGLEVRMPLLFAEGVLKGRISIHKFVELTATNPAKIYGLYPRKGTIAIGSDADIVLWDTQREVTVSQDIMHHNADYTPYEGMKVVGWPVKTFSKGKLVCDNFEFKGVPGAGEFIPCEISQAWNMK